MVSIAWTFVMLITGAALFLIVWAIRIVLSEFRKDRVPILLYHHFTSKDGISDEPSNYHPAYFCYDTAFDEQMNYLVREGYTTVSVDDFVAFQENKKALPPKPIILTFDDGFASNYRFAFPILKKYGMTATLFVTVDSNCENFRKYAKIDRPLTPAEIQEMSDYGISIESHSMTHPYLSALSPEAARWELTESKRRLQEVLNRPIQYIAIPSGAYNKTVKRLVKETGYKAAFCMLKGSNNKASDRFALRRLVIGRDLNLEDFGRILRPATACQLRFTSCLQNTLLYILGPSGLDALRDRLYGLGFGSVLTRGQLRYLVPCLGVAAVFFFVLLALVLQSHF